MYRFLLFVHIIAAMVYFGLPLLFGRWLRSAASPAAFRDIAQSMRLIVFLHLNLAAAALLASGLWLAHVGGWHGQLWVDAALVLLGVALVNLNANFGPALSAACRSQAAQPALPRWRLALFAAVHHTAVTVSAALMVFKPV